MKDRPCRCLCSTFLWGNHLPLMGKFSLDVLCGAGLCVLVCTCVSPVQGQAMAYYELTNTCLHTHTHSHPPWGGGFVFVVSLKVPGAWRGPAAQTGHTNMCWKGHLGLHSVVHHPWHLPTTRPITVKDSVMQCPSYWRDSLELPRDDAGFGCLSHLPPPPPHPLPPGFFLPSLHEVRPLHVFE